MSESSYILQMTLSLIAPFHKYIHVHVHCMIVLRTVNQEDMLSIMHIV